MKNNTKLIMETWRRFLKEGYAEPDEGYLDDEYNPDGWTDPDDGLDSPIAGEPHFEDSEPLSGDPHLAPVSDPHLARMDDEVVEPLDNDYDEIPYTKEDANTPDETMIDDDPESFDDYDSSEYYEDFPTG